MIIEGFKSYKDQTIVEPFSRDINVVGECIAAACGSTVTFYILFQRRNPRSLWNVTAVGANGSGKSNFFHGAPLPPFQLTIDS